MVSVCSTKWQYDRRLSFSDNAVCSACLCLARPQICWLMFCCTCLEYAADCEHSDPIWLFFTNASDESAQKNELYFQRFQAKKKKTQHTSSFCTLETDAFCNIWLFFWTNPNQNKLSLFCWLTHGFHFWRKWQIHTCTCSCRAVHAQDISPLCRTQLPNFRDEQLVGTYWKEKRHFHSAGSLLGTNSSTLNPSSWSV